MQLPSVSHHICSESCCTVNVPHQPVHVERSTVTRGRMMRQCFIQDSTIDNCHVGYYVYAIRSQVRNINIPNHAQIIDSVVDGDLGHQIVVNKLAGTKVTLHGDKMTFGNSWCHACTTKTLDEWEQIANQTTDAELRAMFGRYGLLLRPAFIDMIETMKRGWFDGHWQTSKADNVPRGDWLQAWNDR